MTKVIKLHDENYRRLLQIIHDLENVNNERVSFDDAISLLINEHEKRDNEKNK